MLCEEDFPIDNYGKGSVPKELHLRKLVSIDCLAVFQPWVKSWLNSRGLHVQLTWAQACFHYKKRHLMLRWFWSPAQTGLHSSVLSICRATRGFVVMNNNKKNYYAFNEVNSLAFVSLKISLSACCWRQTCSAPFLLAIPRARFAWRGERTLIPCDEPLSVQNVMLMVLFHSKLIFFGVN